MAKTLKASPNYKETVQLLGLVEKLNNLRTMDTNDGAILSTYLTAHESFMANSRILMKEFNQKKETIESATITYNKYSKPSWRTDCLEIINNLVIGLDNITFTKSAIYQEDIKQMSSLITSVLDGLTHLKNAIDTTEINAIPGLISTLNGSETTFKNLNSKLSKVVSDDNEKLAKANSAKAQIAHEIEKYRSFINNKGVSAAAAQKTKNACTELENRLHEFDGLDPIKAYAFYLLLYGQLNTCNLAMTESNAYLEEQRLIQKRKDDEAAALAASIRRKKQQEQDEADRIRRKREQDDEDDRRRISSSYYSSSSSSDSSSSSSSSSSDNSSSFGGGSFDGGGGGGSW
jgi:uncharacterized membrane protein YgcG